MTVQQNIGRTTTNQQVTWKELVSNCGTTPIYIFGVGLKGIDIKLWDDQNNYIWGLVEK